MGAKRLRLVVLTVGLLLTAAACGPADWPMFGFGPARTGFSPDTTISKDAVQSSMVLHWTGTTIARTSPAVVGGALYTGAAVFDAAGVANCSGNPKTCAPMWSTNIGPPGNTPSSPAVVGGVEYVGADKLYAFNAAGTTNCSGSPKVCTPLWAAAPGGGGVTAPVVAGGVVYAGFQRLFVDAFDAAGVTNCSGGPPTKTCAPLWTASVGNFVSDPAVAGGVVYVGSGDDKLYAFDAAGKTNCSGGPPTKTCAPLWTATTGGFLDFSSPAVAGGVVYIGSGDDKLYAFDAAGMANCSGSPKTCAPLWTATTGGIVTAPAVANGVVYADSYDDKLYAFDAAGTTNCSGGPITKTCAPLWTAATAGDPSAPSVANGVVYIGSDTCAPTGDCLGTIEAFDAAGTTDCSGNPKTCQPLWKTSAATSSGVTSSPVVSHGAVYAAQDHLKAFGLK
jgi:outer membrane protein assembly factor BamB